jgi:alkylation response protein AidB-like acyl-CoA dehydrogenase
MPRSAPRLPRMDLRYSESEEAFRAEVRKWMTPAVADLPPPPAPDDWAGRRAFDTGWQRRVHAAGLAGIHWRKEDGGRGGTPTEDLIYIEESERAGAPRPGVNFVGLLHAGPTIAAEGTAEQRSQHLPRIISGEEVWCQGFSEPNAGSDLASLTTRAVRDGDHYVVTGQKIWTSFAHVADYCELLVRTDPTAPKHSGITWLMMAMDSPGIDVRPLRTVGGSSEFSEMFLDEVRIPVRNRVGAENDGWRVAMVTFSFERGTAFIGDLMRSQQLLAKLAELARVLPLGGPAGETGTAWDDAGVRREFGYLQAELDGLWALTRWNVSQAERTGRSPTSGSVFKLAYSEARHRLGDLSMRLMGEFGTSMADGDVPVSTHVLGWYQALSLSIAAGTSQIQRNIISERMLGLPKERR